MQGRFKLWIAAILGCYLVGFLIAFGPLRPAPRGFLVQNVFQYTTEQPVVQPNETPEAASGRLQTELRQVVSELNYVKVESPTELEVATFATTEEIAARDQQAILQALQAQYPDVRTVPLPRQEQEEPIWQLGDLLALYPPRPQLRLGLDLQGGAHVVLMARPETIMSFVSPEDAPLASDETPAANETPSAPPQSSEELKNGIVRTLEQIETPTANIRVAVVSPSRVEVRTRAKDVSAAQAQRDAVLEYLQRAYPGVAIEIDRFDSGFIEPHTAEQVRGIVERRVYARGIREAVVQTQGADRVIVELPGVRDPEAVIALLGTTAELEFALIPDPYEPTQVGAAPVGGEQTTWRNRHTGEQVEWRRVYAESDIDFTGRDLRSNAHIQPGTGMEYVVAFELRPERREDFRRFTARNVGRYMAIVLDGNPESAPVIRSEIPGAGVIESPEFVGTEGARRANDLALLLNAGALPVPLQIEENRTVSATLGADSVRRSLVAGLVGIVAVMLFMVALYRLPGLMADIALTLYLILLMAVLTAANATITLPGIAAFIMSLGMAVDANILIFERIKEELYAGKTARSAVAAGFDRAWAAILDANVTTLIGASVLYFLGTSAIKSFAVTLFLGILCNLFTAVTVTRWLMTILAHTALGQRLAAYGVPKSPSAR